MGIASLDLAIMADRVRELRADARRDEITRSARRAYTGRPTTADHHGTAAAKALRGLVQASLARNDR